MHSFCFFLHTSIYMSTFHIMYLFTVNNCIFLFFFLNGLVLVYRLDLVKFVTYIIFFECILQVSLLCFTSNSLNYRKRCQFIRVWELYHGIRSLFPATKIINVWQIIIHHELKIDVIRYYSLTLLFVMKSNFLSG